MAFYLEGSPQQENRAYSPAVITEGGRIVWMAGQTATVDADGKDISGDFEAQTHRVFALMDQTRQRAGGTLANLVTMTVFVKADRPSAAERRNPWSCKHGEGVYSIASFGTEPDENRPTVRTGSKELGRPAE
jgi:enamine deaminase RidA (YjgF/YER057c/UK114 family)